MTIPGTKKLGDWGKMVPASENSHITQTNVNSHDGYAAHVTTQIPDTSAKVHDYFDSEGNYLRSSFGQDKQD